MFQVHRLVAILGVLLLPGCDPRLQPSSFAGQAPVFRAEAFFDGSTTSFGVLESRGGAPTQRFDVQGQGRLLPDGAFELEQTVHIEGEPSRSRTWHLRQVDAHHYTGTLTDASGPVQAEAYGNLLHVTYPMRAPFAGRMEQWLYLQSDGRAVLNEATIRVLGVVVARLSERITHEGS